MAKVKNPTTLSGHFGLDPRELDRLNVLDPTLAVDTRLFIDPLLFGQSQHPEVRTDARRQYRRHFERVIKFLRRTVRHEDVAWRTARQLLEFHEVRGTCLGYGANTIQGSGFGSQLTEQLLITGKEIVELGIEDPDLFSAMALFEDGIGPDRISDMATNVVREALVTFNRRILAEFQRHGQQFGLNGVSGEFLPNPFSSRPTPIILVPRDILRQLPIVNDWDEIADAASHNTALRNRVNEHLAHIWERKTKRDKQKLKEQALSSEQSFQTLLDAIHGVRTQGYDVSSDPQGLVKWASIGKSFTERYPLKLSVLAPATLEDVYRLTLEIVSQFKQLIEHNGLNKELYTRPGVPRHESTAQRLFFAVAHSYCKANNVDISPEVDSGSGQVDFKLSSGFENKVLVEVKLSINPRLVSGYKTQLEVYKQAERTLRATYLVIDVGSMGHKYQQVLNVRNMASSRREPLSHVVLIDGKVKLSASRR